MHATQNGSLQAIKFDPYGMVVLVNEDHGRPELPYHTYARMHWALCRDMARPGARGRTPLTGPLAISD
jgi:hypothetical protein